MEITNSYVSGYYAASMYMSAQTALSNAYQRTDTNARAPSSVAASFQSEGSTPARRLDRSDPTSLSLSLNVYGPDGRSLSGILDRSETTPGNPILSSELSSEGLPDRPELLFTHLANGLFERNAQSVSQNLEKAQQFSEELSSDATNMKDILQNISKDSMQALDEKEKDDRVSDKTTNRLSDTADRFVNQYNETMSTLANAPGQSRQTASIQKNMELAVTDQIDSLNRMGITQNDDNTLSFDADRFRQTLSDDPRAVQDLFGQDSDLNGDMTRTMDIAENTRVTRNAELSSIIPASNSFSTYASSVQSSSMISMAHIPTGYFVNRLA